MVHLAGPYDPESAVQRCQRCGVLLTDHRGAMVPADDPRPLGGWAEGAFVEVITGNPKYSGVTSDAPDCQKAH